MNGALAGLILLFLVAILAGKHVRKPGLRSFLFIFTITVMQVAVVLYFIFTAESPVPH